jgi:hypothetical protein
MGQEGGDFDFHGEVDVLTVIRCVCLPQQQVRRTVMSQVQMFREVRIPCGNDGITGEKASPSMIGMKSVALPRVVAQNDIGFQASNFSNDTVPQLRTLFEFAIDLFEKENFSLRSESPGGLALLLASQRNKSCDIGLGIPSPFRSIGEDQVMNRTTSGSPFCQSATAAEFNIIGVGPDGQSY